MAAAVAAMAHPMQRYKASPRKAPEEVLSLCGNDGHIHQTNGPQEIRSRRHAGHRPRALVGDPHMAHDREETSTVC